MLLGFKGSNSCSCLTCSPGYNYPFAFNSSNHILNRAGYLKTDSRVEIKLGGRLKLGGRDYTPHRTLGGLMRQRQSQRECHGMFSCMLVSQQIMPEYPE